MTQGFDREVRPPPALRDRVLLSLRDAGVLSPGRRGRGLQFVAVAAALAVGFGFGYAASETPDGPPGPVTGQRYALLLYLDSSFRREGSRAERVAEYASWARTLRGRGQLDAGERLADSGRVVPSDSATTGVGELGVSALGIVAGFFIIRAANIAEAIAVASTCPHVRHGGRIVVRPIDTT